MSEKWVDNLLSHHELPGVSSAKQGVSRRISDLGLVAMEIVRELALELRVPLAKAADVARAVLSASTPGVFRTPRGIAVSFDVEAIQAALQHRAVAAVDSVAPRARGRPPRVRDR